MSNRQERKARKAAGQQARFDKEFAERGVEAVYTPTPLPDYASVEARIAAVGSLKQREFLKTLLHPFRYGFRSPTGRLPK